MGADSGSEKKLPPIDLKAVARVDAEQVGSEEFKRVWAEERDALPTEAEREAFDRVVQAHIDMLRKMTREAIDRYINGDPLAGSPPHPRSSIEKQ